MFSEVEVHRFAAAHADGAVVIDVREPWEYEAGHVPGAHLVPLSSLAARVGSWGRSTPLYVICQSGARSARAAALLSEAGFDVRSVRGGTSAWSAAGLPLVTGRHENAA